MVRLVVRLVVRLSGWSAGLAAWMVGLAGREAVCLVGCKLVDGRSHSCETVEFCEH